MDRVRRRRGPRADADLTARESEGRPGTFLVTRSDGVLQSSESDPEIGDPDISWDGAAWQVFYSSSLSGRKGIAHVETASLSDPLPPAETVLDPSTFGVDAIESPSFVRTASGTSVLIARVRQGAARRLEVFVQHAAGDPYRRLASSFLPGLTLRDGTADGVGFDADEIAAPAIEVVGTAFHLYYAGREGTRWAVGLLASEELNYYRQVSTLDGVLGARGRSGQFDALGVLDLDVVVDAAGVTAVYLGSDGARRSFGIARRAGGP